MNQLEKAEAFRSLHDGPRILILPNAWDAISARLLASLDFPAIATTSAASPGRWIVATASIC